MISDGRTPTTPRESRIKEIRHADIVGAIRLALVAAHVDASAVRVIQQLCEYAPETPQNATGPVELLLDAVRDVKGKLAVEG